MQILNQTYQITSKIQYLRKFKRRMKHSFRQCVVPLGLTLDKQ